MSEDSDGRIERTILIDGEEWTARLMSYGEDAQYHVPGTRIHPELGIRFTRGERTAFFPCAWSLREFLQKPEDVLAAAGAMMLREAGAQGESLAGD